MGRNFDKEQEQDQTFTVGGESFTWRWLHWSEWADWVDGLADAEERVNGTEKAEEEEPEPDLGNMRESCEQIIERIAFYLIPEDRERFKARANNADRPMTFHLLADLRDWLVEVQAGRPTQQQTSSTGGRTVSAAT